MSLEDIAGLVAAWPTDKCQSLQARLRAYVARRISEVHQQRAELSAFERQLQAVLGGLSAHDPGPDECGRGCYCETDLDSAADETAPSPRPQAAPWTATRSPPGSANGRRWPPRRPRWNTPAGLSGWPCLPTLA